MSSIRAVASSVLVLASVGCAAQVRTTSSMVVEPAYAASAVKVALDPNVDTSFTDSDCDLRPGYKSGSTFLGDVRAALSRAGFRISEDAEAPHDLKLKVRAAATYCSTINSTSTGNLSIESFQDGESVGRFSGEWYQTLEGHGVAAEDAVAAMTGSHEIAERLARRSTPTHSPAPTAAATELKLNRPLKMLVMPLRAQGGVSPTTCQLLTSYMLASLDAVAGLRSVGQDDIQAVLGVDRQKQALGCDELACMAELGGALGVDVVMYGEIGAIGSKYNVNLSIVRANDAVVAARVSTMTEKTEDALASGLPDLVSQVVSRLNK